MGPILTQTATVCLHTRECAHCVYTPMSAHAVLAHRDRRSVHAECLLSHSPPLFLRWGLLNLELTEMSRRTGRQVTSWVHISSAVTQAHNSASSIFMWALLVQTHPYARPERTLPTEPFSAPLSLFFKDS